MLMGCGGQTDWNFRQQRSTKFIFSRPHSHTMVHNRYPAGTNCVIVPTQTSVGVLLLLVILTMTGCWQKEVGRSYYESGKLRTEATVRNGLLDGPATMYYESGSKMSEAYYKNGMLDGMSVSFYPGGEKQAKAVYSNGVLHGNSSSWHKDGTLLSHVEFERGRLMLPPEPVQR